jgi:5-methylcytosine-specific restriction protein B
MNRKERQKRFLEAAAAQFGTAEQPRAAFGKSNVATFVEGGLQLGVINLDGVSSSAQSISFASALPLSPDDQVYFAVQVKGDIASLVARLDAMKRMGTNVKNFAGAAAPTDEQERVATANVFYGPGNNNVAVYLATDGRLWLRNKEFWETLNFDPGLIQPAVEVESIAVALYPPATSVRRSLLSGEFIGWLGKLVGEKKVHEVAAWSGAVTLPPAMRRMPKSIPIEEIEDSVVALGGHYPNREVRRLHAAFNFLAHKHFVILTGLSGTGKTQLALKYAKAVHGVSSDATRDPLVFECPVRPEWTDPTSLTGYFDVLTNRYVVPKFLEAVLMATAQTESPVFVILDEMNLARVEYYLSDVLSCMESRGYLKLHSSDMALEGPNGEKIQHELKLPENLFIIGTINIDETTNPVSDKVLDRASVIEMSTVDVPGFLSSLENRFPELKEARALSEKTLTEIHSLMGQYGLGFGYRLIEEFLRYHAFDALHLKSGSADVTDQLLVQKVLVKLRGAERQRELLKGLNKICDGLPRAQGFIRKLLSDLDDFGSFQAMR